MTTAGEGGMVVTNSERLWSRMWSYKDHGKSYDKACRQAPSPGFVGCTSPSEPTGA